MPKSPEVLQAEMQKDIEFIKVDIASMKQSMDKMSESLDNLAQKWQEIGGLTHGMVDLNNRMNEQDVRMQDHSGRITALESLRLRTEGAAKVVMILMGMVGSIIGIIFGAILTLIIKH